MAPKFGLDDGSSSNFDAKLVLATMRSNLWRESHQNLVGNAEDVRFVLQMLLICGIRSFKQDYHFLNHLEVCIDN